MCYSGWIKVTETDTSVSIKTFLGYTTMRFVRIILENVYVEKNSIGAIKEYQ